ncbi:MAG: TSUP family transporter [Elusimicrobia bacterium]|nr:TSUP family transporter [Elusimicrobiota bacterium]
MFADSCLAVVLAFAVSAVAGWIDAIAGGGGLLTLPFLLNLGLPPALAIGTNKLQSTFGSMAASWRFASSGHVDKAVALRGALAAFLGSLCGAWLLQRLDPRLLAWLLPFLLSGVLAYMLFSPGFGQSRGAARFALRPLLCGLGLALGFYDGFFGPGTGTLWAAALVGLGGLELLGATGYAKIMNFSSNAAALCLFVIGGNISYEIGAVMAIGQLLGSRLGASMAIKRGPAFVRPLLLCMSGAMVAVLFYRVFR